MNVLSLFDGMSCGQIALNKIGLKPSIYYASEIEKNPQIVSKANFPDTVYLGDVKNVDVDKLLPIDLIIGGSPCQSFSFAGKRKGMSTKDSIEILTLDHYLQLKEQNFEFEGQSYLFWEYMRVLTDIRKYNPDIKFLLENVMMGKKWERILTEAIGIEPICINSALVSAQNRKRLYWTNIYSSPGGIMQELFCNIPQPKDKKIFLKDILQSPNEVDEKYFLKQSVVIKLLEYANRQKEKGNGFTSKFHEGTHFMSALKIGGQGCDDLVKINKHGDISPNQDKASCFTAGGHSGGNHSDMDLIVHNMMPRSSKSGKGGTGHLIRTDGKTYCIDTGNTNAIEFKCVAMRGRDPENPSNIEKGLNTEQRLEPRNDNKTNCLTSVQKDNLIFTENYLQWDSNGKNQCSQTDRAFYENGKNGTLGSGNSMSHPKGLLGDYRIRRLTPIECERLQCVDDNYTAHVSNSARYKMLGNGWNIDTITHILSFYNK